MRLGYKLVQTSNSGHLVQVQLSFPVLVGESIRSPARWSCPDGEGWKQHDWSPSLETDYLPRNGWWCFAKHFHSKGPSMSWQMAIENARLGKQLFALRQQIYATVTGYCHVVKNMSANIFGGLLEISTFELSTAFSAWYKVGWQMSRAFWQLGKDRGWDLWFEHCLHCEWVHSHVPFLKYGARGAGLSL